MTGLTERTKFHYRSTSHLPQQHHRPALHVHVLAGLQFAAGLVDVN